MLLATLIRPNINWNINCQRTALTRLSLRQERARPIFEPLRGWLEALKPTVLPKSPIGKAIHYFVANADALGHYLSDPQIEIDNNRCERAMRQIAVGRKNWLFAGSDKGGRTAATLFTLIASAALHDLDPYRWLRDALARIADTPISQLDELLPDRWKASRKA